VVVKDTRTFGTLILNSAEFEEDVILDLGFLSSMLVGAKARVIIMDYVKLTKEPITKFKFNGMQFSAKPTPTIVAFSSQGPSPLTPEVFKPNIIALGVYILVVWTRIVGPTSLEFDNRKGGM